MTVTTAGGTSAAGPADLYTYDPVPTVTLAQRQRRPPGRWNQTDDQRHRLHAHIEGQLRRHPGQSPAYISATELSAESPAGTGTVNVTVKSPGGTSATSAADDFTYVSTPTVSKLTPTEGPEAGKTTVTIEGSGFTGATAVSFGATPATKYKVESPTTIVAEAPAGKGTAAVTVKTPGGTSAETPADIYTYDPVPRSPASRRPKGLSRAPPK